MPIWERWCRATDRSKQGAAWLPACRAAALEAEEGELRAHADWQAQRIQELQGLAPAQLARKYDAEMQALRSEFEAERRRLQAELAAARAGQPAVQVRGAGAQLLWVAHDWLPKCWTVERPKC